MLHPTGRISSYSLARLAASMQRTAPQRVLCRKKRPRVQVFAVLRTGKMLTTFQPRVACLHGKSFIRVNAAFRYLSAEHGTAAHTIFRLSAANERLMLRKTEKICTQPLFFARGPARWPLRTPADPPAGLCVRPPILPLGRAPRCNHLMLLNSSGRTSNRGFLGYSSSVSSQSVNGPSFTSETSIMAANTPVATRGTSLRARPTKYS